MKRIAVWAFYGVGALAIAYLALYAYAVFTGNELQPGDPIRIFRKPDAPSYSAVSSSCMDGPLSARVFLVLRQAIGERSCIRPLNAAI